MKKVTYHLSYEECEAVVNRLASMLYLYCQDCGLHYVVTGSSGGRDSAVILGIAQRACQKAKKAGYELTSVGVVLPCKSDDKFTRLGKLAIETFGAEYMGTDLSNAFDALMAQNIMTSGSEFAPIDEQIMELLQKKNDVRGLKNLGWSNKIARGNVMARLRMITLYLIAGKLGSAMVLSTDNLSEYWMGFWTINGDVGDYGMIQNLLKGLELEDIAKYLGAPVEILEELPNDGLGITDKGDAGQLGVFYPELDDIMVNLIQQGFNPDGSRSQLDNLPTVHGYDRNIVMSLVFRAVNSAYKRRGPIYVTREELGVQPIKDIKLR